MSPDPAANITLDLVERARSFPDDPALIRGRQTLSYARLDAAVWRAARALHDAGARAGDTVATTFRDEPTFAVTMLAAARLGATSIAIPAAATTTQRAQWSAAAGVRHVATDDPAGFGLDTSAIVVDPVDFEAAPAPGDASILDPRPRAPLTLAIGSGSTGRRKLLPVSHAAARARARGSNASFGHTRADRNTTFSPLEYASSFQRFLVVLDAGGAYVFLDRVRDNVLEVLERQAVTVVTATVFHVERMLAALPQGATRALPSLRSLVVSSSTVSHGLRVRIRRALTPNLYVLYGTNETLGICLLAPGTLPEVVGSVGRPLSGMQVEVVDAQRRPLPAGLVGEVRVRGAGAIDAYLDDPSASRDAFVDGWFHPGDLGLLTPDGQLVYRGRSDHMMIVSGVNIYPAEIEQVLLEHPEVADAAAFPLADPVHQDVPVCAVALAPSASVGGPALDEWARQRLGALAPRHLVVLERIPRNELGKLVRSELSDRVGAKLARRR